jgi:signal transduction histidine kinase
MVDQSSGTDNPAPEPPAEASASRQPKDWSALSPKARSAVGSLGGFFARVGGWLASLGWGKFVLLSLLLLTLASLTQSLIHGHDHPDLKVPVDVHVAVDTKGLHVTAPKRDGEPGPPKVQIDDNGIRVQTEKNGRTHSVVIDRHGVRVEDAAGPAESGSPQSAAPAAGSGKPDAAGKSPEVTIAPDVLADPDKVSEAVDAAKEQIEEIVQEQVARELAGVPRGSSPFVSDWPDLTELALVLLFALMIVKVALGSKRRAESRAQAADAVAAEEGLKRQLAEARLKTMQAQVEPHFLFNTLASVDYLIETDPARASRMQKNLIQYLRAALPQMRQASSTLGQEMVLCRSYLEILKVRMDDRLQFAITLPAGLSTAAFPPMMLQTLVENSIKHGLEPKPEGGTLTLSADVVDGNLRVTVSDSGLGFGAAGLAGSGVGLNNVRERLAAVFGARARLTIEPNSPGGTIATIEVPYTVASAGPMPQQAAPQAA